MNHKGKLKKGSLVFLVIFATALCLWGCGLQKQEEGIQTYRFYVKIMNGKKQLCDRFYIAEELETIRQMTVIKNVNGWVIPGVKDHEIEWNDHSLEYEVEKATGVSDRPIRLSDTWDITELEVHEAENLEDVIELPNLEKLIVWGEQIENVESIEKLTKLNQLTLRIKYNDDLEFIGKMTALKSLDIYNRSIRDFSFLGNLTNERTYLRGRTTAGYIVDRKSEPAPDSFHAEE